MYAVTTTLATTCDLRCTCCEQLRPSRQRSSKMTAMVGQLWERIKEDFNKRLDGIVEFQEDVAALAIALDQAKRAILDDGKSTRKAQQTVMEKLTEEFKRHVDSESKLTRNLQEMIMADRKKNVDFPSEVCILPPWEFEKPDGGLTAAEQDPASWRQRREKWQQSCKKDGKHVFFKKTRLFLVCSRSQRLVPSGHNGQGYEVKLPRTWFRRTMKTASTVATVGASAVGLAAAAPVAGEFLSEIIGGLATAVAEETASAFHPETQGEESSTNSVRDFVRALVVRMEDKARSEKGRIEAEETGGGPFVFYEDVMKMEQQQGDSPDKTWMWVLEEKTGP